MSEFWNIRISNANKFYDEWATNYKCDILEKYYKGGINQWKGRRDYITVNYNPYTLNLFNSTIKIKLSGLIFQKPAYLINAKPDGFSDWDSDLANQAAGLKQDTLNTIVQNRNMNFPRHVRRAARDSFFRFGIIETGYAADWRNPQKEDPLLSDHGEDPEDNIKKVRVLEDNLVPTNERFFVKRINPKRFRVSVSDASDLNDHEWCGYYDFFYTKNLKKTKGIKWPTGETTFNNAIVSADLDANLFSGGGSDTTPQFMRRLATGEISKVWHIWDLVDHKRLLLLDDNFSTLWEDDCDRLPLVDLRWDEDFESFYPIPPSFQWISPQDEINEAREQMRSFRRRFTRKYWAIKGRITPLEAEKFASGPDGIVVEWIEEGAMGEIPNSAINPITEESLAVGKDDFNQMSAVSAEGQAQPDRGTATSAKITDARAQIRESADQLDFSVWMCAIGESLLVTAKEKLVNGLWIKDTTSHDQASILQDIAVTGPAYKYIQSQDLSDGYDYEIDVDVMNQTPAAMAQAQQSFITFLSILQQFPMLALSPVLIRKAAVIAGMRDERVIHQMQQAVILTAAAKITSEQTGGASTNPALNQGQGGQNPGNTSNAQVSQMADPTVQQTNDQIQNQLVQ